MLRILTMIVKLKTMVLWRLTLLTWTWMNLAAVIYSRMHTYTFALSMRKNVCWSLNGLYLSVGTRRVRSEKSESRDEGTYYLNEALTYPTEHRKFYLSFSISFLHSSLFFFSYSFLLLFGTRLNLVFD
jgi:hypothetical protein